MVAGFAIFGARDPHGIRPLVIGSRPNQDGKGLDWMLASIHSQSSYTPDIFEFFYFSCPNSIIDGISVYESRQNMELRLANTIRKTLGREVVDSIDIVVPIPDSVIVPALSIAEAPNRPYRDVFSRNRYIFQTFIMPNQEKRRKGVQSKLNPLRCEFKDKNVILVEDSIVRGTTSLHVCNMAREAGTKKVYFASSSPAVTYAIRSTTELVACNRDRQDIATLINADEVVFLTLEDLESACAELSPRPQQRFEVGVFCGRYVTPVSQEYLEKIGAGLRQVKRDQNERQWRIYDRWRQCDDTSSSI
ncbi:Amidophosphoribosyltransferase [Lachnellula subtilissima]|uniref:Amidophosphoribosyltransferase n=1 Tax=Lachnellula subtilissima TaxID=602034 RepID=A0A8H8RRH4_9HELO|nr:Amidophosphoribosyltransferase [Lachnellula subtilissima]